MPAGGGRWRGWGGPVLLAVAGALAYARSFTVPFQFDDLPGLVEAAPVHLTRLDWASLAPLLRGLRPLAMLSFGLCHWLWGLAPAGWHAVNLAIHLAAAGMAALLAGELLRRLGWADAARRGRAALLTAALFLLHPVQTQAVTYLVQRMASMAGLLALCAAWLWFRGRRAERPLPWLAGAGLAWAAAVLTKENTLALPVAVALAEAILADEPVAALWRHRWLLAAAALLVAALGAAMLQRYGPTIASEQRRFGISVAQRLLTQPRVLLHYLSLLAWPLPSRLRVDHDFPPSAGLLDPPSTLAALAALLALCALAFRLRRREPLVTLAVAWFLGCLLVENTALPVDLAFEQRLYLPSFGPFLLAAAAAERALGARPGRLLAAAAPVLLLLGLATDQRNRLWNDPAALHAQVVADYPGSVRSQLTVGKEALDRGDLEAADRAFRAVLARRPASADALGNLGNVARARGDRAGAEALYRRAVAASPGDPVPRESLGVVLAEQGRLAEAERELRVVVGMAPGQVRALTALGSVRAQAGDLADAVAWFGRAAAADPASAYPLTSWGWALLAAGKPAEALPLLERAVRLDPRGPEGWRFLAACQARLGRVPEAAVSWRALLALQPRLRDAHFQLGNLLAAGGDLAGAEREYQAELALGPHTGALTNLGSLAAERDPARARVYWQQALQVDPRNAVAAEHLQRLGEGR